MRGIKRRLEKLKRVMGVKDHRIIILDYYSLTPEERAVLDAHQDQLIREARVEGLAVVLYSRKKAQELLALAERNQDAQDDNSANVKKFNLPPP